MCCTSWRTRLLSSMLLLSKLAEGRTVPVRTLRALTGAVVDVLSIADYTACSDVELARREFTQASMSSGW